MNSVTRISNLSDQLQNTITINRDWKAKVEAFYKEKEKNSQKSELLQLDLYNYQAYYTLPDLAREVFDHDNIIKLARLLYTPEKYSKLPN